jgi:hypothetical protein
MCYDITYKEVSKVKMGAIGIVGGVGPAAGIDLVAKIFK